MGVTLSDVEISREIAYGPLNIDPFESENLQPASYDLTLGSEFIEYQMSGDSYTIINPEVGAGELGQRYEVDTYVLDPGEFILATTVEEISLPDDISAEVKGRSSLGRLGVIPHTAGWIDPGFEGTITLEFVNHNDYPVALKSGMRCCQIIFNQMREPAKEPYGEKEDTKYQGQHGVTASRIEQDND